MTLRRAAPCSCLAREKTEEHHRCETGTYPHVEGFVNVPLDLEALKNLLALHECTHVVMPRSLTGEEYPDFFIPADGFVGLLEEGVPAEPLTGEENL